MAVQAEIEILKNNFHEKVLCFFAKFVALKKGTLWYSFIIRAISEIVTQLKVLSLRINKIIHLIIKLS